MDYFEFGKPILSFMTVGVLRELLKDYSDNTVYVLQCQIADLCSILADVLW